MAQIQLTLPIKPVTNSAHYEDELTLAWMESLKQISKSKYRYKKPSANDYEIYTPDIDHGICCRCCTPIDDSYLTVTEKSKMHVQKRRSHKKKSFEKQRQEKF